MKIIKNSQNPKEKHEKKLEKASIQLAKNYFYRYFTILTIGFIGLYECQSYISNEINPKFIIGTWIFSIISVYVISVLIMKPRYLKDSKTHLFAIYLDQKNNDRTPPKMVVYRNNGTNS